MKAAEQKLSVFLGDDVQLIVPSFQRPYSWTQESWVAILHSVLELRGGEHFLGAMVTMPLGKTPNGLRKYLLIDGQHRLMTVMLLVAALRDHARRHPRELGDLWQEIDRACLFNPSQSGSYTSKLLPTRRDRGPFEAIMRGEEPPAGRPLTDAHASYLRRLAVRPPAVIKNTYLMLANHFMVVEILLEKDEDPYPIFKSLSAPEQSFTKTGLDAYYHFSPDPELMALIAGGESQEVEFKESAVSRPAVDRDDGRSATHIVRSVAAFANSETGGTLLIGVRDDGTIRGVNDEYRLADKGRPNWDGYQLYLNNQLRTRLSIETAFRYFATERRVVEGRDICMVRVQPAPAPVYLDKHLFVRSANQTLELQGPDLVQYVATRWPDQIRPLTEE